MSRSARADQLYLLVAVAVPGLTIVLARFAGAGASGVLADVGLPDAPAVPGMGAGPKPLPEPQASASLRATTLLAAPTPPSPFAPSMAPAARLRDDPRPTEGAPSIDPPGVHLGGIYVADQRPIAVIDGRLYRIGQRVADDWALAAIDPALQSITLRHRSGALATMTLHEQRDRSTRGGD